MGLSKQVELAVEQRSQFAGYFRKTTRIILLYSHSGDRCDQKITVILNFRELRMFDSRIFFLGYISNFGFSICF